MKEKVVLEKVKIDPHFRIRAQQRTDAKTEQDFKNMINTVITMGEYIGETQAETGGRGHMFAQGKRAIILSLQLDVAITVIDYIGNKYAPQTTSRPAHKASVASAHVPSFKGRLEQFYIAEFKRLDKKEKQLMTQLEEMKLKYAIELAELKYKEYKTTSAGIKFKCIMRANEINDIIKKAQDELSGITTDKRVIAKARVSIG